MPYIKSHTLRKTGATLALALLLSTAISPTTATHPASPTSNCERLTTSLTYSQDAAPTDVSGILRVVVEKINRDVTGVVDVEVEWSGAELHKRVGERIVKCTVTRLHESVNNSQQASHEGDSEEKQQQQQQQQQQQLSTTDELGRQVITQCFEVPITVLDIDECSVPKSNSMAHRCHESSICVNTLGSYECVCPADENSNDNEKKITTPGFLATMDYWNQLKLEAQSRSPWELSLPSSTESSCPGMVSTHECCEEDGHSKDGRYCRSSFQCPVDPCADKNNNNNNKRSHKKGQGKCASNATCQRSNSPLSHPDHTCLCPPGTMGNGKACVSGVDAKPEPKVRYDGVTPTEDTKRKLDGGLICGCTKPVVDACSGFPKCPGKHEMCIVSSNNTPQCACQPGYVHDTRYGCVDEHPPILHLNPDPTHTDSRTGITRLTQGDRYQEYGVDIKDTNAEEYLRSLKITYSRPLPPGCLFDMGEFYVNYTVATPWTTPEFVRAKRTVVIENINECKVKLGFGVGANCPELAAMCDVDAGAMCKDEIGTYSCQCPEGTEGDGFKHIPRLRPDGKGGFEGSMVPMGYSGGTGCRDTSRPVIEILGPNPKIFRVAKVNGLEGVVKIGEDKDSHDRIETVITEQRGGYGHDLRYMIRATSGAELCATSARPNVRPTDCIRAKDHTYKGTVDLTGKVSVGEPTPKDGSPLHWRVPYNVIDEAGNKAKTVWRDIIIEEVDLNDFERKARSEAVAHRKNEIENAVNDALEKERKRAAALSNGKKDSRDCPICKPCKCNDMRNNGNAMTVSECNSMCDGKIAAAVANIGVCSASNTCTPSYYTEGAPAGSGNQMIDSVIAFMEGLMGPSALMTLLVGCTVATGLYVLSRIVGALFSSSPDVRTYYHSRDDDEREKIMMQNVSYYRSPPPSNGSARPSPSPGSATSIPRPPTASMSAQRNGIFSTQQNRSNGGTPQPQQGQYTSPFATRSEKRDTGNDNIYQSMSPPITPARNKISTPGDTIPSTTPGSRYNLRSTNY